MKECVRFGILYKSITDSHQTYSLQVWLERPSHFCTVTHEGSHVYLCTRSDPRGGDEVVSWLLGPRWLWRACKIVYVQFYAHATLTTVSFVLIYAPTSVKIKPLITVFGSLWDKTYIFWGNLDVIPFYLKNCVRETFRFTVLRQSSPSTNVSNMKGDGYELCVNVWVPFDKVRYKFTVIPLKLYVQT